MSEINTNLYRAEQVRAMDSMAIQQRGIPGTELMERAGLATFQLLQQQWPRAGKIAVFCGTGNNGGDGYVIARLANEAGMQVSLYQLGDHGKLKGDALTSAQALNGKDIQKIGWDNKLTVSADVIVDALLGTGLNGEVSDHYREAIEAINQSRIPVLAVDIPSGLHADTGCVLGDAVMAKQTISFIGLKQGLYTGQAADYVGELHFSALAIPHNIYDSFSPSAQTMNYLSLQHELAVRSRAMHKGQAGHVLIIGGNTGFSGAARLAGEAALRAGAGLVSVATRASHAGMLNSDRPELMVHGVESVKVLQNLIQQVDVIAIGPGLDQDEWAQEMFAASMQCRKPKVVDADALNLLAANQQQDDNWILTPHPGEAARLLDISSTEINSDRYKAVDSLQQKYAGTVVLKGSGSLLKSKGSITKVCTEGNPGMASGGMGDVLTGIIASLWGQGLEQHQAAALGVCLHARAADLAALEAGERGMLASDLMPRIRQLVNH